jgi:hypothetical protein
MTVHTDDRRTAEAPPATSTRRQVVYWVVSLPVLAETALGIQWDFARNPTVVDALATIGFPDYMADVLGVAKVLALAALLVPGFARLKEWAYAGLVFVYLGAAACHFSVDDEVGAVLTPLVLGLVALASWALRPASRRDPRPLPAVWASFRRR